jgi:transcriptional regulator GlxA family with amidase domain
VSPDGGAVATNSGVEIQTRRFGGQPGTLLVAGGSRGLPSVMARTDLRRWLQRIAPCAKRYGSVCTGAFVLAAAGLLDGKRVATHWASCGKLAQRYPALSVDADALYVIDGKVWTSAGVTTGIDMALALVEADLGAATANLIARHLVLYARRPGYQSQFSPLLQAQTKAEAPFADLIAWMQSHLDATLDVPTLARRAGLSERSFYRKFTEATGKSPAQFVERLRLEAARTLMAKDLPLKAIAGRVGLGSSARLGAAFERGFGMTPSLFREMHRVA